MMGRRLAYASVACALMSATVALAAVGDSSSDAGIDFRKSIALTPQETVAQSKDYYTKMQETQRRICSFRPRPKKTRTWSS